MTDLQQYSLPGATRTGYRAVNSKFPPISLFDDVVDADEFDALYELQRRTNPRLLNEAGVIERLPRDEIPFGIPGCSYAVAPFVHLNPAGSRFSDGSYGVLYIAQDINTALAEASHHQSRYWQKVDGLAFDRILLRGLRCTFDEGKVLQAGAMPNVEALLVPDDYTAARAVGKQVRDDGYPGIYYASVRHPGGTCWGLFTPRDVQSIIQTSHYEMIWDGRRIASTSRVSTP